MNEEQGKQKQFLPTVVNRVYLFFFVHSFLVREIWVWSIYWQDDEWLNVCFPQVWFWWWAVVWWSTIRTNHSENSARVGKLTMIYNNQFFFKIKLQLTRMFMRCNARPLPKKVTMTRADGWFHMKRQLQGEWTRPHPTFFFSFFFLKLSPGLSYLICFVKFSPGLFYMTVLTACSA